MHKDNLFIGFNVIALTYTFVTFIFNKSALPLLLKRH